MKTPFTNELEKAITKARKFANKMGDPVCNTVHLLYGIAEVPCVASKILKENSVRTDNIYIELMNYVGKRDTDLLDKSKNGISEKFDELLIRADSEAKKMNAKKVGTDHVLIAIIKFPECFAYELLDYMHASFHKMFYELVATAGGDIAAAKSELIASRQKNKKSKGSAVFEQYTRDLNSLAKQGKIDPVIGRDDEISSVVQILSRRTKNNPCLIGDPGVGKTAIAEGLATLIVEGNVPDTLIDKKIFSLDLSGMVAGTRYRGEFEERIKRVISEISQRDDVLLFIDELHTVIGAGGAEGALDASNILKPVLARGEIRVIGATTRDEYRKRIEKDPALERRFQPVIIEEPTKAQTIEMLQGLKEKYEDFHKVVISDEAIDAAVNLSVRYVNDRFLPDKAIDLIDEAAASLHLKKIVKKGSVLSKFDEKNEELEEKKIKALSDGDIDLARLIREEQLSLVEKYNKEKKKLSKKSTRANNVLGKESVAAVVSKWTHIPVEKIDSEEKERLRNMESILHKRVVGQNEAVVAVARAIRRGRAGLKDPNRPIGSFLFLGPTGVGKTELTKTLAEAVFGSEKDMIRVDMSEYMEKASVSKMVGAPPGYVGHEEGGQLSEKVRQKPYSVVLFDEIEKAHPDVFNMLLQVLEDGHITDAHGRKVDFKNTIIIMTSNAGANRIVSPKTLGFGKVTTEDEAHLQMKEGVMEEVKRVFKPEFINRIDEMIVFHTLSEEDIRQITKLMLDAFIQRTKKQVDIDLEVDEAVIDMIAKKGFDKVYGARPIRRALQKELEDMVAESMLNGDFCMGEAVSVSVEDGKIVARKKSI